MTVKKSGRTKPVVNMLRDIKYLSAAFLLCIILYKFFDIHFSFNNDTWYFTYANCVTIQNQIRKSIFPFWTTSQGLGLPLITRGSIDLLTIPLMFVLSVMDYLVVTGFFYLIFKIYFMYRFLLEEGFETGPSLAGGVVWGANGYFLWHLHELAIQTTAIYIPIILICIKRMANQKGRAHIYWIWLIAINSVQLTYGRWDLYEYSVWVVLLYIIFMMDFQESAPWKKIKLCLTVISATALSFFLIAPITLPYLEVIKNAYRRQEAVVDYYRAEFLIQHLLPNTGRYDSRSYISIFGIFFGIIGVFKSRRIRNYSLILISLYVILAFSPFKGYELLRLLPFHKETVNVIRINLLFNFGVTFLFVAGLQAVLNEMDSSDKKIVFYLLFMFAIIIILYSIYIFKFPSKYKPNFIHYIYSFLFIIPTMLFTIFYKKNYSRTKKSLVAYICIFTIIFSFVFNSRDKNDGDLKALKSQILKGYNLGVFSWLKQNVGQPNNLPYRVMDNNLFRPGVFSLQSLDTISFYYVLASDRLCELAVDILGNESCAGSLGKIKIFSKEALVLYSLSSIKYFIFKQDDCNYEDKGLIQVHTDNQFCVAQNLNSVDRIRFVSEPTVIKNREDSLAFFRDKSLDWFDEKFIIGENLPSNYFSKKKHEMQKPNVSYLLLKYTPSHIKIKITSDHYVMMSVNNRYDPNWHVLVDGVREKLYRINVFFQGVLIRPGTHIYELRFFPRTFKRDFIFSMISLLLILAISLSIKKRYAVRSAIDFLKYHDIHSNLVNSDR